MSLFWVFFYGFLYIWNFSLSTVFSIFLILRKDKIYYLCIQIAELRERLTIREDKITELERHMLEMTNSVRQETEVLEKERQGLLSSIVKVNFIVFQIYGIIFSWSVRVNIEQFWLLLFTDKEIFSMHSFACVCLCILTNLALEKWLKNWVRTFLLIFLSCYSIRCVIPARHLI